MSLRPYLLGTIAILIATPTMAQDANVDGRVTKLEKEMRAVQRVAFPNGAGKFIEPDIKTQDPTKLTTGTSSATSDLIARVDALETQLANVTGQVEKQSNDVRNMETRLKSLEAQMKAQTAASVDAAPVENKPLAVAPVKPATTAPIKPATTKPSVIKPATEKPSSKRTAAVSALQKPATNDAFDDSYSYGYRLWEAKFYPEAQTQLEETVKKFPSNKRLSFARNLLGRAWLDDGKPATAVKIFYDNYKNDPRGERASDSLYFLGESLSDLGKNTEACEAFGQLATAYPAEAKGRLADRLLAGRKMAHCK